MMPDKSLVISAYPLTDEFRRRLERQVPEHVEYATAASLRSAGFKALLKRQWQSRFRRVLVASQVAEAEAFVPLIALVALGFRLPTVALVDPCARIREVSTAGILLGGGRVVLASADAAWARAGCSLELRSLKTAPRQPDPAVPPTWSGQRILYIKNMMWFGAQAGGSVGHVAGVINGLASEGAEVSIVSPTETPMLDRRVRHVRPSRLRVLGIPSQANLFRMQRGALRAAIAEARTFRPTMVYQRLTLGDFTGALVAKMLGIPLVVEYNGSEVWCLRNWGDGVRYRAQFEASEQAMLDRANYVFTISEVLRDELLARGVPGKRVGWYPNGVDAERFSPARFRAEDVRAHRKRLGFGETDRVVTFVGTFGDWHGAEVLAHASVLLCGRPELPERPRLRFMFVGDGRNRQRCEMIVAGTPAADACTFVGLVPQHETPEYLAASDILVSPHVPNPDGTPFFGSPTKLFEYMAMGKPIVASALGQISKVLVDGETALLVRPGDPEALAAGIRKLLTDPAAAEAVARNARQEAVLRYSWKRHVEELRQGIEAVNGP